MQEHNRIDYFALSKILKNQLNVHHCELSFQDFICVQPSNSTTKMAMTKTQIK